MSRSFYAFQDTKTPLIVSLITLAVAICFELWFVFGLHTGAAGIAWGQVIWAALELACLIALILRRVPDLFDRAFWQSIGRMVVATALMSVVTYVLVRMINLQFENQNMLMVLVPLGCIGIISVLVYLNPILTKLGQIVSGRFLIRSKDD